MESTSPSDALDIKALREEFPVLDQEINGKPLVYLDNAATTQKPKAVIEALDHYYRKENSNIHRGNHYLSQHATERYEEARKKLAELINAPSPEECIFTSGTTEGINCVASAFAQEYLGEGDEILLTGMEHHSNIVPWQMARERSGARIRVLPVKEDGTLELEKFDELLNKKTRILALTHVSNTLGTINPVKELIDKAHKKGIPVLLDGAQAVPHMAVDVQELDADFYIFSGHKMFGPTGIGVLYGKKEYLDEMPPFKGGGEMIDRVSFEKTSYAGLPNKFEAGTPPIAEGIAMGATVDFIRGIGYEGIRRQEEKLLALATERLKGIEGLEVIGDNEEKAAVISFIVEGTHPSDLGVLLDQMGIAIRTGHHCTQPLMDRYGIPGTARASFAFYNDQEDVERLVDGVKRAVKMLK